MNWNNSSCISQAYSLPIFVSAYPPLNNYIKNVLLESLNLLYENKLQRLELRLYKDEVIQEKFFVDINYELTRINGDELETEFRYFIHSLETCCKSFKKASKDCRFKILLHTKTYDFSNESKCQDSLWIRDNDSSPPDANREIIPIVMKSTAHFIQFYAEKSVKSVK